MADMIHYIYAFPVKYKKKLGKLEKILKDAGKEAAVDYLFDRESRMAALLRACILLLWDAGVGKLEEVENILRNFLFDVFMILCIVHDEHKRGGLDGAVAPRLLTDCVVDDEYFADF